MMNVLKRIIVCAAFLAGLALLSSCMPGGVKDSPAGFFAGVWHGWIAPFMLVYSLFNKSAGIYEVYNTGFAYNLGYYMAIISGFGGLALRRGKKE